ncbi:MAG: hypothetical protein KAI14_02875 [Dehalococcoidales bacterium]|nr:hypothetical protein [Dehalococcoidales bacterium]
MNTPVRILLVLGLILVVLSVGCQSETGTDTTQEPTSTTTTETQTGPTSTGTTDTQTTEPTGTETTTSRVEIIIQNLAFSPEEISILPGTEVRWTNMDSVAHTVTSFVTDPDEDFVWHTFLGTIWDSGELAPGESFSVVFTVPGIYSYISTPYLQPGIELVEFQTLYVRPVSAVSGVIVVRS